MASYLKNTDLREEIIRCKENDELTPEAINMFMLLATRMSNCYTYKHQEDKEDCISFAMMDLLLYWRGYNPEKSQNAFAYYSGITLNGFKKAWRKLGYHSLPVSKRVSLSTNNIYNI